MPTGAFKTATRQPGVHGRSIARSGAPTGCGAREDGTFGRVAAAVVRRESLYDATGTRRPSARRVLPAASGARVGRLVYLDDLGPLAVPVNFTLAGHDIVLRVEGGAKRAAMEQPMLAFEVDHVDEYWEFGWSVLVRGTGAEVDMERVPALLRAMDGHFPAPWAFGIHNVWLQDRAALRDWATPRCRTVVAELLRVATAVP